MVVLIIIVGKVVLLLLVNSSNEGGSGNKEGINNNNKKENENNEGGEGDNKGGNNNKKYPIWSVGGSYISLHSHSCINISVASCCGQSGVSKPFPERLYPLLTSITVATTPSNDICINTALYISSADLMP